MKDKLPGPSSENEQQPDQYLATTPVETPAEHEEDDYGSEEEQSHWKKLDDKINRLQAEICWAMEQKKKRKQRGHGNSNNKDITGPKRYLD